MLAKSGQAVEDRFRQCMYHLSCDDAFGTELVAFSLEHSRRASAWLKHGRRATPRTPPALLLTTPTYLARSYDLKSLERIKHNDMGLKGTGLTRSTERR